MATAMFVETSENLQHLMQVIPDNRRYSLTIRDKAQIFLLM
jgi:hypothetical protein